MSENTKIEWCDDTWNPWRGCEKVSLGCKNCYAERLVNGRLRGDFRNRVRASSATFNGPLRWNKSPLVCGTCDCAWEGLYSASRDAVCSQCETMNDFRRRRIFLGSLMDWLDPKVPVDWLAEVLDVMRRCENIDFLCLTKRPELFYSRLRMVVEYLRSLGQFNSDLSFWTCRWSNAHIEQLSPECTPRNVWVGVSVEDQERADERIPALLKIPAKVRFVSAEPLLHKLNFTEIRGADGLDYLPLVGTSRPEPRIHWVIIGGESGPGRRDCGVEAIIDVAEQCQAAGVPCFVKQASAFRPGQQGNIPSEIWRLKEFPRTDR